jgi:hypothetical protein
LIAVAADHATVLLVADLRSQSTFLPLSDSWTAICVIAVVGVAPCQRFKPGGNQTRSPARTSSTGPLSTGGDDQNLDERMAVPRGSGTRFEGNLARANARAGLRAWNSGSIRTVPEILCLMVASRCA